MKLACQLPRRNYCPYATVARSAKRALVVADLPFGRYEVSSQQTVVTGVRFLDMVGLRGGKIAKFVKQYANVRNTPPARQPQLTPRTSAPGSSPAPSTPSKRSGPSCLRIGQK